VQLLVLKGKVSRSSRGLILEMAGILVHDGDNKKQLRSHKTRGKEKKNIS